MASGGEDYLGDLLDQLSTATLMGDGTLMQVYESPPVVEGEPYLRIAEQPQTQLRFRYESEGNAHGGIQGSTSNSTTRTYPTVEICNYRGRSTVTASLFTSDKLDPHVHQLVGVNCANGECSITGNLNSITFQNLSIQHVKKTHLKSILKQREEDAMISTKLQQGTAGHLTEDEKKEAKQRADERARSFPLNELCICFRATLINEDGTFGQTLTPVFTNTIFDSKSASSNRLKICRVDRTSGGCSGGDEVFLLCEKVKKEDIRVRFSEEDEQGLMKWRAYGDFQPGDVHYQYAIVFKTPAYRDQNIESPVVVNMQLERRSDHSQSLSEPIYFTYQPNPTDIEAIGRKRKKILVDLDISDHLAT